MCLKFESPPLMPVDLRATCWLSGLLGSVLGQTTPLMRACSILLDSVSDFSEGRRFKPCSDRHHNLGLYSPLVAVISFHRACIHRQPMRPSTGADQASRPLGPALHFSLRKKFRLDGAECRLRIMIFNVSPDHLSSHSLTYRSHKIASSPHLS